MRIGRRQGRCGSFAGVMRAAVTVLIWVLATAVCTAQTPTGTISGVVRDASGGTVAGAVITVVSRVTRQVRITITGRRGEYSLPALRAGEYEIAVEATGFQRVSLTAVVEAGGTTRADCALPIGEVTTSVTVAAASPQLRYESAAVTGLIAQDTIAALPLNGRNFLELAKLEPGVQAPASANRNRILVPILGAPGANVGGARFTIDGGSVTSIGLGGAQMGLSQEIVREFQLSSVNFNLSAGLTHAGAVNVVTRGGSNRASATAFYFYRDHHLSAYPALVRDPANPDPSFRRQQFGGALGGPIRRDRFFYFGSWERNDQQTFSATKLSTPEFAGLSRITPNPLAGNLLSLRADGRISGSHSTFIRYSHDGSDAFGPAAALTGGAANAYPSNWNTTRTGADQTVLGLTSVVRPTLVNDLRVSYFGVRVRSTAADEDTCPRCLGIGAPSIGIPGAGLLVGNSSATDNLEERFELHNVLTWQKGRHRLTFGADWERNRDRNLIWSNEPVGMTLFAPDRVRLHNARVGPELAIPLPASFETIDDILQLPVTMVTVGYGEPRVPQENGTPFRTWNTVWLYVEDAWRLHDRVTATYGLGWGFDGVLNHDLHKPALLAPILGADGLGPTERNWRNFAPAAGVAWTISSDGKTVLHAGAGRFHGPHGLTSSMDNERVALGPPGLGRQSFTWSTLFNPPIAVPQAPAGAPIDLTSPSLFTGAVLMSILPALRASLTEQLANADLSLQRIQITKQAAAAIFPERVPNPSAVHVNAGLQREVASSVVVGADVVYRRFTHVPVGGGSIDLNQFRSVPEGPAIRRCSGSAEPNDPQALCSTGPINVQVAPYRFAYKGVLVRAEKRLSRGVQLLASYALSRNAGTNTGPGFSLYDWLGNEGPAPADVTHLANAAGTLPLLWGVELGFNFSYASVPPFSAFIGGADFDGDGAAPSVTAGDLLPGTTAGAFNRGLGRADLQRLVDAFNTRYGGTRDKQNALIPIISLPAQYSFGDRFQTLDLRLSRSIRVERARVSLLAEAFNVYNAPNRTDYSGDLTRAGFGQPGGRVAQTSGSGGARSVQLAIRVSF
jgi:hypothetical protein